MHDWVKIILKSCNLNQNTLHLLFQSTSLTPNEEGPVQIQREPMSSLFDPLGKTQFRVLDQYIVQYIQ